MFKINKLNIHEMKDTRKKIPVKIEILGVDITNASREEVLEYIDDTIKNTKEKLIIVTPNPEIIVYAHKHPKFKTILNSAQVALPDGIGIMLSGKILGKAFKERIPGVDFMEKLCEFSNKNAVTVGFLGGRNGVAELAAERLREKYPGLKIVFVGEEWKDDQDVSSKTKDLREKNEENILHLTSYVLHPKIDILFVAFGFPKQEEWMYNNIDKLNVRMMMGVGGAFDYISGQVPRAPKLLQTIGLEWLYRLIRQPWRWKRQLALGKFIYLVLKEKFTKTMEYFLLSLISRE